MAVRNLNEISGVLKKKTQRRRRRRWRVCWPGEEEDIISHSEHIRTHLASSKDQTYSNPKRTEIIISLPALSLKYSKY